MKIPSLIISFLLLLSINCFAQQSVKDFGAKGDGVTDDTQAFMKAIQSASKIIVPKGIYNIKGPMAFNNLQNKEIIVQDATIKNTDNTKTTIAFTGCNNIGIHGGTWTYTNLPTGNGHDVAIRVTNCRNVSMTNMHILGSSEQGICLICVINGNFSNNVIEQCFRDGIYSHYCSGLVYACNYIHDIKDDAMSIHDYGIPAQRGILNDAGIPQAGNSIVFNNVTKNTYEGFSSIGCTRLFIANNTIQNTVNSGIAVFNSETLFKGSTARANHIVISGNKLSGCGGSTQIIGKSYPNDGQLSTGRAAIFVGVLDERSQVSDPKSRIQYVTINNNTVSNSFEDGTYLAQIDHLNLFANNFKNNNASRNEYAATGVEIKTSNVVAIDKNVVADNRQSPGENAHAYSLEAVTGNVGKWTVNSVAAGPATISSPVKAASELSKDASTPVPAFSLKPGEYKLIRQKFNTGILTDYINLIPPASITSKISYNACIDPVDSTVIIILSNKSRQLLAVAKANWTIREFYHN